MPISRGAEVTDVPELQGRDQQTAWPSQLPQFDPAQTDSKPTDVVAARWVGIAPFSVPEKNTRGTKDAGCFWAGPKAPVALISLLGDAR